MGAFMFLKVKMKLQNLIVFSLFGSSTGLQSFRCIKIYYDSKINVVIFIL